MKIFIWVIICFSVLFAGCYNYVNDITLVAELPKTEYYSIDGLLIDIGIIYNTRNLIIGSYPYNKRWCVFNGNTYWEVEWEILDEIAGEAGIMLPKDMLLPNESKAVPFLIFMDKYSFYILLAAAVIIAIILFNISKYRFKKLKPYTADLNKRNAATVIFDGHYTIQKYNDKPVKWSVSLARAFSILLPQGDCVFVFDLSVVTSSGKSGFSRFLASLGYLLRVVYNLLIARSNEAEGYYRNKTTVSGHIVHGIIEAGKTYFLRSFLDDSGSKDSMTTLIVEVKETDVKEYLSSPGIWRASCINTAQAYDLRGLIYTGRGQYDLAIADFDQVIQKKPNDVLAYDHRGNAYLRKGNFDRAIEDYNQGIRLDPNYATAYDHRADAYYRKGNFDRAIEDYNREIQLTPFCALAYDHRGNAYYRKGNYDRAIEDYNQAIQLNPNDAFAYNDLGNAYFGKLDNKRAAEEYSKAIQLKPNIAVFHKNRAHAYFRIGNFDRAIEDYTQAIQLNPNDAVSINSRGRSYNAKRDYDNALIDFDKAIQLNQNDPFFYDDRGYTYHCKGNFERAIDDYTKAILLSPKYAYAYNDRGNSYKALSDFDRAIADYSEAARLDPNNETYKKNLNNALQSKGNV